MYHKEAAIDENEYRESRRQLRRVMDHLMRAAVDQGAVHERINMVEVITHPDNSAAEFNFIAPRKNTAFVSGQYLQQGFEALRAKGRVPRIHYMEGVFPPLFAKLILDLDYVLEREIPVMLFIPGALPVMETQKLDETSSVEPVSTPEAWALWASLWRTARYGIDWVSVEDAENEAVSLIDPNISGFILRQAGIAVGAARLRITHDTQENSASGHVEALFAIPPNLDRKSLRPLAHAALQAAVDKGCAFVFIFAQTDNERGFWRTLGFVDTSSLLYYVGSSQSPEDS